MSGNVADQPLTKQTALLSRRNFLRGSAIAAAGLALYSGEIARHEISVLTHTLGVRNLPEAFQDFRVAQISDIHFDEFTEPFFVRRVVEHINSLKPDLVLLTGDFISISPRGPEFAQGAIYRCLEILRGIAAPRFACMGNHDSIIGAPALHPIFASYDLPLLMNGHVPIERDGKRLWLCGVGDYMTESADLDLTIPAAPDGPVLLMCHAPDYVDEVIAHPRGALVDLMFSGHTHGGQVRIPFLPPYHLPAGGQKYIEGLFRFNQMQLYVNKGIGAIGVPFRLNCPPEITLFTLERV
jgi:predicted MPP superfamily phosphohydrolase